MDITRVQRDPTQEPGKTANRLAWMAWEGLWQQAARTKNEKLLAKLIGTGLDTPKKQNGAELLLEEWAKTPKLFEGKLMRLLMRNDVSIPPHLVAPLCACGDKAIEMMQKHRVDLTPTNFAGENGLALACLIPDDAKFERAWRLLRQAGLDPNATDSSLESAMHVAENYGRIELVERIEASLDAEQDAQTLHEGTPNPRKTGRNSRL